MRLKCVTAASLPAAMRLVRQQLGSDAVILSTQKERGRIKVTAALEEGPLDSLEIGSMVDGLVTVDQLSRRLDFHRLPPGLAERVVSIAAGLPAQDADLMLAGALDAEFGFLALSKRLSGRRWLLAGPPGAGKTVTAAKLCARARLGGLQARLITMDGVKSGAIAQIESFAKALGVPLVQAPDHAALRRAVEQADAASLTVIDTLGCNPFAAGELDQLARAAKAASAEMALVLSAGGDTAESAEIAVAFAKAGARAIIPTKLDLARRLGGVLAAAHAAKLAFLAAGVAPTVADGLASLNPVSLARLILPAPQPVETAAAVAGAAR